LELHLLSAGLRRRDSFNLILSYINLKDYSREFQIIVGKVKEYYDRDNAVNTINREIFLGLLAESVSNKKHLERFTSLIDQAYELATSIVNVDELILKAKQNEVGEKLATSLANKDDNADKLIEEYKHLKSLSSLEELNAKGVEVYTADDLDEMIRVELAREGGLRLYPLALNERLDNRLSPQHHVVTFARPEMGKTALNLTIAGGFARQGAEGLYFINEDRTNDLYIRQVSNLTGMSTREIHADPAKASRLAKDNGLGNIRFIALSPGNLRQVETFVEKYSPKWIVMDQLRNLDVREANKVLQLEYATSGLRNLGKKWNCIVVSTTQAGDSAEGKSVLEMGDIDFSNTGVPAQADVLLGLGGTRDQVDKGIRIINLPKNKVSGRHENFPVRLNPFISRYVSLTEDQQ
jgi:hypothetical protein